MEQQKLEKLIGASFILTGIAIFLLVLWFADIVPFTVALIFAIIATIVSVVTGAVLFRDSQ